VSIDREKVLAAAQKLVEKKKYDKAVLEYQKLIQEDPNDARTLLKIGDLQSKMEAYADAVATYERVGKHYASQGFALKAIAVYKQIREIIAKHLPQLEEKYGHITPKLAELYQQLGLVSDALAALDEVATRLQRQGRDAEAIEVFRKIVELDPTNPLPHLRLAEALSRDKDLDGAVAEFGTAGTQLAKLGRRDDAIKVFERLLHHKQDSGFARTAAELYLARAQPNDGLQALAKLQVCFQQNPKDLDTLGLLARSFNAIGQANKAIEVQKEMARLAQEQGKVDVFRQLVEKLVKLAPNDDGVKRIVASMNDMAQPASSVPPPPAKAAPSPADDLDFADDDEVEAVATGDVELEDEQPFEMRPSAAHELDDDDLESASNDMLVENVEIAEEVNTHAGGADLRASIARILSDAAALRKQRAFAKAVETLRNGVRLAPRQVELRAALRDVLLEAGQTRDAIDEMLDLASLQVDSLDGDGAAQTLQDALAIDPSNARAAEMLRELGYEMVDDTVGASEQPETQARYQADLPPMREQYPSYDPDAPLPSYDLEEIGPEAVARHYSDPGVRAGGSVAARLDDIDDPFGGVADGDEGEPLPQFPLDAPVESAAEFDLVPRGQSHAPEMDDPFGAEPETAAPRGAQAPMPELESALEEAEFFATRGLFDDARTILQEQLGRLPNHPLILDRMAELDSQEGSARGGSGTRAMPTRSAPPPGDDVDRSFDIAQSLDALDASDRQSNVTAAGSVAGDEQIDVEAVFAKFKEGVSKQIDADDGQSHYDLGVAYREMGLIEDAMREFEQAARDPKQMAICESMIGMIEVERGNLNGAIDAFLRGLRAQHKTPDQEMVLSFEVGTAYESKKMTKEALSYYQRVARRDANYRDVGERIRRIQGATKGSVRAAAVGADDEFDRAFDDILGGGKLP
jgi:tetratricopeptide (TPR) repeat protein